MAYERDVLTRVTEARAAYPPTAPIPDQAVTSDATTAAVRTLFAVVERYPDIKAQRTSWTCRTRSSGSRAMIADRRELYNDQVYRYNTRIAQVPGALIAPLFGWRQREFFAVDPAETTGPTRPAGRMTTAPTDPPAPATAPSATSGSSAMARPNGRASAATPAGPTSR